MEDKVGLTLACLNIKKLVKTNIVFDVCLYSDISAIAEMFLIVSLCIRV